MFPATGHEPRICAGAPSPSFLAGFSPAQQWRSYDAGRGASLSLTRRQSLEDAHRMKAVAKSGVMRFRIGTEATPAMIRPHIKPATRFALRNCFASSGGMWRMAASSEIPAPEQIAVAEIEGDEVDAGDQQKEQREDTASTTRRISAQRAMAEAYGILRGSDGYAARSTSAAMSSR